MRGVERSETAPYVQHANFAIEPLHDGARNPEIPASPFRARTAIIWRAVRNRRGKGAKFQRQVPPGDYIVDFICFEYRLAVEIDGPSHEVPQQRLADRERDNWLREQGFRVLRLANELVIASTELAMARIRDALAN